MSVWLCYNIILLTKTPIHLQRTRETCVKMANYVRAQPSIYDDAIWRVSTFFMFSMSTSH